MHRRTFLRLTAGAAAALSAGCAARDATAPATSTPDSASPAAGDTFDPVGQVAPDADEVLSVVSGSFEQLVGAGPFAFGLVGPDNTPVNGADVEVWVVPVQGETSGPYPAAPAEIPGQAMSLYTADVQIDAAGPTAFVAVTAEGQAGSATLQVSLPESSPLPAPGQEAVAVATPTEQDTMGFERLCTLDPPCGMHEVSLDEALAQGRPAVLLFATPAYCQTVVCGPSVQILEDVRRNGHPETVAFVHCEIYVDAGATVAEPVQQWRLPSEPWMFTIGSDGVIVDRIDGALLTLPEHIAAAVQALG